MERWKNKETDKKDKRSERQKTNLENCLKFINMLQPKTLHSPYDTADRSVRGRKPLGVILKKKCEVVTLWI
jgi:hypothetical protein